MPSIRIGRGCGSAAARWAFWDPAKPPSLGQPPPLTPEYQKVFETNLAKGKAGVFFDIKGTCGPVGMPRVMILYEPMEIVIRAKTTYLLLSMKPNPAHLQGRTRQAERVRPAVQRLFHRNMARYRRGGLSDADPQRPERARPEISAEVFSA
jgi:hypothetical protein